MYSYIEFWCISEDGISLYHHSTDKNKSNIGIDLVSSFLSALQSFIKEHTNEKIEKLQFKNSHLFILHSHSLYFFLRTKRHVLPKREKNFLIKLKNEFIFQFKNVIIDWKGRVDEFKEFDRILFRMLRKKNTSDFIVYQFGNILRPSIG